jgi:hypothetical protein
LRAALITVSYRGDLLLARELCTSIDTFVDSSIEHVLVVPSSDVDMFAPLVSERRRIVTVESVLPVTYRRVLRSFRLQLGPVSRRFREMWITPVGLVRGWIMQQIVKLSSDSTTTADVIVFADSDLVFVAPFAMDHLTRGNKARLYLRPGETKDSAKHRTWHLAASKILGLPPNEYFGADYIGNPISWRRDVLAGLKNRIAEVSRRRWQDALAATPAFSEFILYGVFADHILGEDSSGHFHDERDLTRASWHYDEYNDGFEAFAKSLTPEHVAVLIQSTEDMCIEDRRRLVTRMVSERTRSTVREPMDGRPSM